MLIDCIGYSNENSLPKKLTHMIRNAGSIQEIKSNAFKALHDLAMMPQFKAQTPKAMLFDNSSPYRNNLFVAWLICNESDGGRTYRHESLIEDVRKSEKKVQFLQFVEQYCQK